MKSMIISDFKARCIAVLKEVQRTGEAVVVTRRGQALARVEPLRPVRPEKTLGTMEGALETRGDLVHADTTGDWEE